ncbi:tetratricopeptide repeat protein [uncultured Sphingomonas sp.]|uniref:tetratricopeptide repeat protein n=1 Tax=uncultured Sphingomonas sp. TaxID=158754 RepID=UPI0026162F95|nr:tetratricopeptide repeat protein [uncultured Sphingomonas sp.]
MKSMYRAAIAAALLTGVGSIALVTPAAAKEKKAEEPKAAPLKLSKDVQPLAAKAQAALQAKDYATAEPLIQQVSAAAKSDDDKYIASIFQLQLAVGKAPNGQIDDNQIKGPIDALIANPRTPQADQARFNYQRGIIAANAKQPQEALAFFQRAQQLGYNDPNLPLQMVKIKMEAGDIAGGSADLEKSMAAQIAAGQKPDEQLYRYAMAKTLQKRMIPDSIGWMKRYITAYPTAKNWRDIVFVYGIQQGSAVTLDKAQKVDLFRLLRMKKALADQFDYEIYAQYAIDLGLPNEGKAVIDEGRAAGKLPADSVTANDLYRVAKQSIANEGSLDPLDAKAKAAANGKLAAGTADAHLGAGNYAKAIELYKVALQKGGVDADAVNTHLGIALANSGDTAGAKAAFELVKGAPRADIASFWLTALSTPAA